MLRQVISINKATMNLTDIRIEYLNCLLISPNREWAAQASGYSKRTYDCHVNGHTGLGLKGFSAGFKVKDFNMLRNALLLEDLSYRDEVREYGLTIVKSEICPLSNAEALVANWLFSSKSPESIGHNIGCERSTVLFHMDNIANKILAPGYEQSRFNICSGLLTQGYPKGFQGISTDFTIYENSIPYKVVA
jgi:hypothetical protein